MEQHTLTSTNQFEDVATNRHNPLLQQIIAEGFVTPCYFFNGKVISCYGRQYTTDSLVTNTPHRCPVTEAVIYKIAACDGFMGHAVEACDQPEEYN